MKKMFILINEKFETKNIITSENYEKIAFENGLRNSSISEKVFETEDEAKKELAKHLCTVSKMQGRAGSYYELNAWYIEPTAFDEDGWECGLDEVTGIDFAGFEQPEGEEEEE